MLACGGKVAPLTSKGSQSQQASMPAPEMLCVQFREGDIDRGGEMGWMQGRAGIATRVGILGREVFEAAIE